MWASRDFGGVSIPAWAVYIVVVIVIAAYGWLIRSTGYPDHLEKRFTESPMWHDAVDGWWFTHVIFFGLLGVLYPGRPLEALLVGTGWEFIESYVLGSPRVGRIGGVRIQLVGKTDREGRYIGSSDDDYFYGKGMDIAADMIGYTVGSCLSRWAFGAAADDAWRKKQRGSRWGRLEGTYL